MRNASLLRNGLSAAGLEVWGGVNAPYIWVKTPGGLSSWEFSICCLKSAVSPHSGLGFGPSGEGYFRLTAFGRYEDTVAAVERLSSLKLNK